VDFSELSSHRVIQTRRAAVRLVRVRFRRSWRRRGCRRGRHRRPGQPEGCLGGVVR